MWPSNAVGCSASNICKYFGKSNSKFKSQVGPLREEVRELEIKALESQEKSISMNSIISQLEERIVIYKDEYALLISDTQTLKNEMELVQARVDRSVQLLENLSSERDRWERSRHSFGSEIDTLVGDVLLSAAYLTYGGVFDQYHREILFEQYKRRLEASGISFQKLLSIPEYLTTAEERSMWLNHDLPTDDLCLENAVMISRHSRYPLLIDPTGQALLYLQSLYKKRNVITTRYKSFNNSFRDASCLKVLESAIRFGSPIIIQDVQSFDPIIKNVLNQDVRRIGGRSIVRLGAKDVDFSPSFILFMITSEPDISLPTSLTSKVSMINFSVTSASLRIQCLERILKSERPDIDSKRKDLVKMQGEFQLKLLSLEKALLDSLNDSTGNILDDDHVMNTLETLKKEANEISAKIDQTENILEEVNVVTSQYSRLAENCSSLYFAIQKLSNIQPFYQFSLEYFFFLFDNVLKQSTDQLRSSQFLEEKLFGFIVSHLAPSLKDEDYKLLVILATGILDKSDKVLKNERDLLSNFDYGSNNSSLSPALANFVKKNQIQNIARISEIDVLKGIEESITCEKDYWTSFFESPRPEELPLPKLLTGISNSIICF